MKSKKRQTSGKGAKSAKAEVVEFTLINGDQLTTLDRKTVGKPMVEALEDPYVVYLCNRCNWTATHIKDESGRYTDLRPPIARTCSADRATCFRERRFAPLLTTDCTSRAFNVALRVTHPSGVVGDTGFVTVQPDCRYTGIVFYLEIPDPA